MDRINNGKLALIKKIDKAWNDKHDLYGIKYDIDKGYIAYRNAIMNLFY